MRYRILSLIFLAAAGPLRADDWPQWLGPNRDGTSKEILKPWTAAPKPLWHIPVGDGHSSPIVLGQRVYLFTKVADKEEECLQSFDVDSGHDKVILSYPKAKFTSMFGNGPRSTPVAQGNTIWTYGNTGVLSDVEIGENSTVGHRFSSTLEDYKAKNLFFGISASPLIADNLVVVPVGGKGCGMVAFDKKTGKEAWHALDDPASYAAPVFKNGQIVALTGANAVGLSLKGEVLWSYPFKDLLNESSTTPVVIDNKVIVSSVTAGSVCLEIKEAEGKWTATEVWKNKDLSCYFSTPIAISKEHMLMVNGEVGFGKQKNAKLRCVEIATGKMLWEKADIGKYHASLIKLGDDKVLGFDDNGYLFMIEANPKEFRELCRTRLFTARGNAWAHPALSNGKLYVRSATELYCFDAK